MKKLMNLILICSCVLIAPTAYAEEPSIFEAGMEVKLYMPKETIIGHLESAYKLSKFPEDREDCWAVHELDTNKVILQICFEHDILVWAAHDWTIHDEDSSAYSLGNSLFSLLSNITRDTTSSALIKTETKRGSAMTLEELQVTFPHRRVLMTIVRGERQRTIQVSELIFN